MNYTKRDLELIQILRDNFKMIFTPGIGLCSGIIILKHYGVYNRAEMDRTDDVLQEALELNFPDYQKECCEYVWYQNDLISRIKFLDDLITKIKNSLSS